MRFLDLTQKVMSIDALKLRDKITEDPRMVLAMQNVRHIAGMIPFSSTIEKVAINMAGGVIDGDNTLSHVIHNGIESVINTGHIIIHGRQCGREGCALLHKELRSDDGTNYAEAADGEPMGGTNGEPMVGTDCEPIGGPMSVTDGEDKRIEGMAAEIAERDRELAKKNGIITEQQRFIDELKSANDKLNLCVAEMREKNAEIVRSDEAKIRELEKMVIDRNNTIDDCMNALNYLNRV